MDSAYMCDIVALIGRHKWKMNMLGTAQENRTGADTAEEKKATKKNTYEAAMWQYGNEPLCYAIWSDNNFVRNVFNFHTPVVVGKSLKRKRMIQGTREKTLSAVLCPQQNVVYLETFHLIDKGNGAEAKYDLARESKKHEWNLKLSLRLFNMNFNSAYRIYLALMVQHNSGRMPFLLSEGIIIIISI